MTFTWPEGFDEAAPLEARASAQPRCVILRGQRNFERCRYRDLDLAGYPLSVAALAKRQDWCTSGL